MSEVTTFTIDTAVAPAHRDEILDYIDKYYLLPKHDNFGFIKREYKENGLNLYFTGFKLEEGWRVEIEMESGSPIVVTMEWDEVTPEKFVKSIKGKYYISCSVLP